MIWVKRGISGLTRFHTVSKTMQAIMDIAIVMHLVRKITVFMLFATVAYNARTGHALQ